MRMAAGGPLSSARGGTLKTGAIFLAIFFDEDLGQCACELHRDDCGFPSSVRKTERFVPVVADVPMTVAAGVDLHVFSVRPADRQSQPPTLALIPHGIEPRHYHAGSRWPGDVFGLDSVRRHVDVESGFFGLDRPAGRGIG